MVKELMFHSITNHQFDANFTEKAIKSLVKRLRQSKELGCIEKLRKAITTKVAFLNELFGANHSASKNIF